MSALHRALYFALQRLRHGVSPAMVAEASRLLDAPADVIDAHIVSRLRATHGPTADGAWLARRPLVERSTLVAEMARLRESKHAHRAELRRTSGSTGTPFAFVKDREMTAWMDAVMWAGYAWHGVGPGDPQARFWGMPTSPLLRRRRRLLDTLLHRRRLSAFEIDPARSVRFFHLLRRFRATHAYGYPTLMSEFAEHCTAAKLDGRDLGLRVAISTGELLAPEVRRRLTAFFGCPVINEYGCTESGILGIECESGTMHLTPVAAVAEVVRPDGSRAALHEAGEVVVTDLYGAILPLTRYRLHDQAASAGHSRCSCGRALDGLTVEVGRLDSFIQTPGGRRVYDAILAYSVPPGVLRFRARQTAIDRLDIDVLPGPGYDAVATPALFHQRLADALGPTIRITISAASDVPFSASGKLRYFVPLTPSTTGVGAAGTPTASTSP
jgi:phenylacetate-CoA ligase